MHDEMTPQEEAEIDAAMDALTAKMGRYAEECQRQTEAIIAGNEVRQLERWYAVA